MKKDTTLKRWDGTVDAEDFCERLVVFRLPPYRNTGGHEAPNEAWCWAMHRVSWKSDHNCVEFIAQDATLGTMAFQWILEVMARKGFTYATSRRSGDDTAVLLTLPVD